MSKFKQEGSCSPGCCALRRRKYILMGVVLSKGNQCLRLPLTLGLHLLYSPWSPRVQRSTAGFILLMRSVFVAVHTYACVCVCVCARAHEYKFPEKKELPVTSPCVGGMPLFLYISTPLSGEWVVLCAFCHSLIIKHW